MPDAFKGVTPLHLDLLNGTDAIARFLFGPKVKGITAQQRVRRAIERGLPVFRDGRKIMARRSRIMAWLEEKERAAQKS